MPYCENCGAQLNPNAKFCGSCGTPHNPPTQTSPAQPTQLIQPKPKPSYYSPPTTQPSPSPTPPIMQTQPVRQAPVPQPQANMPLMQPTPVPITQPMGSESIVGVIMLRKLKSLGRYDTFTGVVTTERLIFAQMTNEMITTAVQQAQDQAKAEGKGFWGQWGDQLKVSFGYMKKYLNMPPEAILAETPGNFALYNNTITEIKVHHKGQHDENQGIGFELEFKTTQGKYSYRMDENTNFTNLLKRVYGDRVRMPFGHFHQSINIGF
jgi:hypothetical protein